MPLCHSTVDNPFGEVRASMDLANRLRDVVAIINLGQILVHYAPLVRDEDIVVCGYRDAEQQREFGSQDVRETAIRAFGLA